MKAEQAFQQAVAVAKKYTAETMQGAGAIKGDDGFSPTVSVSNITGGHKVTITDASGAHSFDVMDGNADIAGGTIGMFTVSKDANIQKDSILNVPKTQIVGHTPIKYPGQIYDIYAGIIWQGKEIYFTSFIIQKETGDWNQNYEIKLMGDPKKLTGDSGDAGGADELLTIKDTVVTNISQLPNDSCCIHAIESHIGFDFVDDIIGYQKYANTVEIFTMDGKIMTLNIGEDGTLTDKGIDVWAKASNVYSKSEVDGKIANYLLCYAGYPPTVEIANGGTKSVITDYFVGAMPTVNSFGIMIYYQGDNCYLIDFNVIATNAEVTDVQFVSNPVQINTPDMTQYYNKSQVDDKIAEAITSSGSDGTTFTPSVSEDGVISWTNDGGKENPEPVNIKGDKGDNGAEALVVNATFTSTPAINTSYLIDRSWLNRAPVPQEMVSGTVTDDKNVVYWVVGKVITASSNPYTVKFSTVNRLTGTNGTNGITPSINSTNKHWMVGSTDTGVVAEGKDGRSIQSITKDENDNIIVTFSDGTTQNIGKLSVDVSADFLTDGGFGNLRYYLGKLEYYDNTTQAWVETSVTPENVFVINMTPQAMQFIIGEFDVGSGHFRLKWKEPADTVIDGQVVCVVDKVVIRRKQNEEPSSPEDGELVTEIKRTDFGAHENAWYTDDALTPQEGDSYHYKAFPYATTGFYNNSPENDTGGISISSAETYGFVIDQNESNPESMITYIGTNAQYRPAHMDYTNGVFDYGDWVDAFFVKVKPCMLRYDGTVDYFLNPNDYTKKEDGTPSDVANAEYAGNAMIQFPKVYWKIVDNGDGTANVYISDTKADDGFVCWSHMDNNGNEIPYCYMPIYNGCNVNNVLRSISGKAPMASETAQAEINRAKANNNNSNVIWYTEVFSDRCLVNLLLFLIGKSTDTKTVFGHGNNNSYVSSSNTGIKTTGSMDTKGLFWGGNDDKSGVKVFGMEHWWGNMWRRIAGWINDHGTQKVKMTYGQSDGSTVDGYNLDGTGYTAIPESTPSGTSGGYISKVVFTESSFVPTIASGSATTYFTNVLYFNNGQTDYALVGGRSIAGLRVGALCVDLDIASSIVDWGVGASISCKPLA